MSQAAVQYVERTAEGGWRIAGCRISLDSVVRAYWEGTPPEAIVDESPSLAAKLLNRRVVRVNPAFAAQHTVAVR
ncbi:MAG: hypothetical protein GXY83_42080 [Rhodopirellula sp.]|nr:hypothetical protein [Rhodopirellula sp.]